MQGFVFQSSLDALPFRNLFAQVAVGQRQRAGAFGDTPLQASVGLLQR